ncbi:succinyl-CoA--3-ketoacid-CoA transferase, partial [Peribacillus butanolivorans]
SCTLPLTGENVIHCLITDLAVFQFSESGMELIELQNGVTIEQVKSNTEADFTVSSSLEIKG